MKEELISEDIALEVDESQEDEAYVSYDIATYPSDFTLSGIVKMWKEKDITIPDFQREYVWSVKQASLLMESFLLGLPVPPVFFYVDDHNKNLVIDGQQRILSTVFFFDELFGFENLQGKKQVFRLQGLDEKSPYYNKKFSDLDESSQRKLKNTVLRAINIRQLSPVGESTSMFHIFERLNTGGTPLKPQEIRNVVFRGEFVNVLRNLNKHESWRKILGSIRINKHQVDVELVLRLFAFRNGSSSYEKPMKEFLNKAMKRNQTGDTEEVKKFTSSFHKTTDFIVDRLGEKPFHLRGRLNTSALDSVFSVVLRNLKSIPEDFVNRFNKLKNDEHFNELTTIGTTDTSSVKERFSLVESYLLK